MTKSTFFKYLPARLKPLGKPAVWIPLTVVTLAGALVWEYHNHPEWFNPDPIVNTTPGELTAEEAAQLSEIDTLDVLLNGSRAPEGTEAVTGQINPNVPNQDKALQDAQSASGNVAKADNPFDGSFEAYPIPGARTTGSSVSTSPAQSSLYSETPPSAPNTAVGNGDRFNFGDGLVNPAAPSTNSALSEAINRRDAARASEASNSAPNEGGANSSIFNGEGASRRSGTGNGTTGGALPAANPVPGSFIRTTPQMSPPVGTTGYQPPATSDLPAFNVTPTQPTRSPYAPVPQSNQASQPAAPQLRPVTPASAAIGSPTGNSTPSSAPGGAIYTPPTSVQPNQGRVINPRR